MVPDLRCSPRLNPLCMPHVIEGADAFPDLAMATRVAGFLHPRSLVYPRRDKNVQPNAHGVLRYKVLGGRSGQRLGPRSTNA